MKIKAITFALTLIVSQQSFAGELTPIVKQWYQDRSQSEVTIQCKELGNSEHGVAECWVHGTGLIGLFDDQHHIWEIQGGELVRLIE